MKESSRRIKGEDNDFGVIVVMVEAKAFKLIA
jgi:hypothetical protein